MMTFDLESPLPNTGQNPSHRYLTEQYIESVAASLITEALGSLSIDSLHKMSDLLYLDPLFYTKVERNISQLHKTFSKSTEDMKSFMIRYNVPFYPTLPSLFIDQDMEAESSDFFAPLDYRREDFTGIVIYAQDRYRIHGTNLQGNLEPALFPRILDPDLQIIYEREMVEPEYLLQQGMVRYSRENNLSPQEWNEAVGAKPLLLSARAVYGKLHTDIILSSEDCRLILANENQNNLLRQGKVFILLPPELN